MQRAQWVQVSAEADQLTALQLTMADHEQIVYQLTDDGMSRRRQLAAGVNGRELYDLPANCRVRFSESGSGLVELVVEQQLPLVGVDPLPMVHVQAEAGRLLRLASVEEDYP